MREFEEHFLLSITRSGGGLRSDLKRLQNLQTYGVL